MRYRCAFEAGKIPLYSVAVSARARRTVLVVEDDRDTRQLLALTFKAAGFQAITVGDGVEALQVLETMTPTLIVLDLGLPRIDGRDVAREVTSRAETRDVPILVVTGSEPSDLPPVACVLHKPVLPEIVLETAEECLRRRPVQRQRSSNGEAR